MYDGLWSDINTRTSRVDIFHASNAPRYGSRHRAMRVDVYTGANIDVITDKQSSARAIENHVRADPTILSDCHVTKNKNIIIATRAVTKSIVTRDLTSIG